MKLIILGSVPSKKNSRMLLMRGGSVLSLPGRVYQKWHREASKQLYGIKPVEKISSMEIVIFAADRRKSDLTNKAESIMDLLVDNKIIPDDNWFIIESLNLRFGGIEKNNPRAEINFIEK